MNVNNAGTTGQSRPAGTPPKLSIFSLAARDGNLTRLFVIMVAIFVVMSLARPDIFPTLSNFNSMSVQFPEIGILAIAIMLTMLTGGIDLSVTSTANLCGIVTAIILTDLVPPTAAGPQVVLGMAVALVVAVAIGLACGRFNGYLISRVGITPILATLGTMTLYMGIAIAITKGTAMFAVPQFLWLGSGTIAGFVPVPLILFAVVALVVALILNRTAFGFRLYMMGTNATAARFSGINNARMLVHTYLLSGLLASIAGLIFLARSNSAKADYGSTYVLQAILIAVLGGVNPSGGFGKIAGLVMALLSLQFLSSGLSMLLIRYSGSNFLKEFAWGALLIAVMVIDYYSNRRRDRALVEKT
jgi:simple sugar transport system permease protein